MARPWIGKRPSRPHGEPRERSAIGRHIAEQVGRDSIADGVTRRRMRRADPPGERVEPEHDRRDVGREVPGEVVIPRVRQLVGEDRPQVVRPQRRRTPARAGAAPGATTPPGKGSRPPTSAAPARPDDSPSRRAILRHSRTISSDASVDSPDQPGQGQAPHHQPARKERARQPARVDHSHGTIRAPKRNPGDSPATGAASGSLGPIVMTGAQRPARGG